MGGVTVFFYRCRWAIEEHGRRGYGSPFNFRDVVGDLRFCIRPTLISSKDFVREIVPLGLFNASERLEILECQHDR